MRTRDKLAESFLNVIEDLRTVQRYNVTTIGEMYDIHRYYCRVSRSVTDEQWDQLRYLKVQTIKKGRDVLLTSTFKMSYSGFDIDQDRFILA